jgi:hypothetical protein
MSEEDTVFRALCVAARVLAAEHPREDVPALVEDTLQHFRPIIDFGAFTDVLRVRLTAFLEELVSSR